MDGQDIVIGVYGLLPEYTSTLIRLFAMFASNLLTVLFAISSEWVPRMSQGYLFVCNKIYSNYNPRSFLCSLLFDQEDDVE
jgi:hypothetical protein